MDMENGETADGISLAEEADLQRELKNEIRDHLTGLAISGLPNIFRSNTLAKKIAWLALFLIALAACLFFIYKNVVEYTEFAVASEIRFVREDDTVYIQQRKNYIFIFLMHFSK